MFGKTSSVIGVLICVLLAAILAVQSFGLPAHFQATSASSDERSITVVGEGKVSAKPDIAQAQIGVEVFAPTVQEATRENNERMGAVMAKLKELGIAEKDIQTSNYSIYSERRYPEVPLSEGEPGEEITYRVSNMVQVTIRQLDQVGEIIDEAVAAGANSVYGISFAIDDPSELQGEARTLAIADAQAKAEELARLAGVKLGPVMVVSEVIGVPGLQGYVGGGGAMPVPAAPISPGELEFTLQVQVTYAIE